MGVHHGLRHGVGAVVPGGQRLVEGGQPVGLVVDDDEAAVDPQHRVDAAAEVAAHRRVTDRRVGEKIGVVGERVVCRQMGPQQAGELAQRRDPVGPVTAA